VLIDLKIGEINHQDLGQMQMYVNYYDRYIKLNTDIFVNNDNHNKDNMGLFRRNKNNNKPVIRQIIELTESKAKKINIHEIQFRRIVA